MLVMDLDGEVAYREPGQIGLRTAYGSTCSLGERGVERPGQAAAARAESTAFDFYPEGQAVLRHLDGFHQLAEQCAVLGLPSELPQSLNIFRHLIHHARQLRKRDEQCLRDHEGPAIFVPFVGEPDRKFAQLTVDYSGTRLIEVLLLEDQLARLAVLVPVLEDYDDVFKSRRILRVLLQAANRYIETLLKSAQDRC